MKKEIFTFFKGSISSLVSALVDLLIFTILTIVLGKDYESIILATFIARIISAFINFIINRNIVFLSNGDIKKESLLFIILFVIKMIISSLLVASLSLLFPNIHQTIIKCIIDFLLFFGSYYLQKQYVFQNKKKISKNS